MLSQNKKYFIINFLKVYGKIRLSLPILIGSIPYVSNIIDKLTQLHKNSRLENGDFINPTTTNEDESIIKVTITDENGIRTVPPDTETDTLLALSKKRVRMPSSILSELYPTLPSPYYRCFLFFIF